MFKLSPLPRTLEAARRDLQSPSERVRHDVVTDLSRQVESSERSEREALLLVALTDQAPAVRRQAALCLADVGAHQALPQLISALSDPEINVRQMVVLALGELSAPDDQVVLGRLAGLLSAGSARIRFQALSAYVGLVGAPARDEIRAGLHDADDEVRQLALRLVDEVLFPANPKDEAVIIELRACCADAAPNVAALAQIIAGEWGIVAPRELIVHLADGRLRAREARDEQLAIELCGRLSLRDAERGLRRRAFGLLGVSLDPFSWQALAALARFGEPRAVARIERALGSPSYLKRNLGVKAAGDAGLTHLHSRLSALPPGACDAELLAVALAALDSPAPGSS